MDLINSHQAQTHVLPGYLNDGVSEKEQNFYHSSEKKQNFFHDLGDVPAHASDENDGVPLSSKESKLIWLAIVVGQIILGLTIYAIL